MVEEPVLLSPNPRSRPAFVDVLNQITRLKVVGLEYEVGVETNCVAAVGA